MKTVLVVFGIVVLLACLLGVGLAMIPNGDVAMAYPAAGEPTWTPTRTSTISPTPTRTPSPTPTATIPPAMPTMLAPSIMKLVASDLTRDMHIYAGAVCTYNPGETAAQFWWEGSAPHWPASSYQTTAYIQHTPYQAIPPACIYNNSCFPIENSGVWTNQDSGWLVDGDGGWPWHLSPRFWIALTFNWPEYPELPGSARYEVWVVYPCGNLPNYLPVLFK